MQKLSLFAKNEAMALARKTDHTICLDDFDDIVQLNKLCLIINGITDEEPDILNMPVSIGGYELRQPTLAAMDWYDDYFLPMFEDDAMMCDVGLAMLLHNPDDIDMFWAMNTKKRVKKAVKKFGKQLKCTHVELRAVLVKLLNLEDENDNEDVKDEDKNDDEDNEGGETGALIAMLCREYGNSPKYWLWEAPIGMLKTYYDAYIFRVEQEVQSMRASIKKGAKPPPSPTMVKKFEDLRDHTNKMRDKWLKK